MSEPGQSSPGTPEEVEALLASLPAPPPRKAFREALRGRFLAGETPSLAGDGNRTPSGVIEDILVSSAPPQPAREAFRRELRERFVAGDLETPERVRARSTPRRPVLRLVVGALAAAAAILVIGLLIPRRPDWRVLEVVGDGPLRIDGVELSRWDLSTLGRAFGEAESFETLGNRVEIGLGDDLVLRVRPDSRVAAGPLPDRSGDGEVVLSLEEGSEVYVRTADGYDGPRVRIRTADLDAETTGTVFGVWCFPEGTCVCVTRGEVRVTSHHAATATEERVAGVSAGWNRQVMRDGASVATGEFPGNPDAHVLDLREFTRE